MVSPLLIFDCDGILVDSETINTTVFHDILLEEGIDIPFEVLHQEMLGGALYKAIELIEEKYNKKLPTDFIELFRRRSYERFQNELKPIDGIIPSLEKITLPKCIASNGPTDKMKVSLTITNVIKQFNSDHIFSAYDIKKWKPEPDLFLYAAKKMNSTPENCIIIEDSLNGVLAAKNANMKVIAYAIPSKIDSINKLKPDFLLENMHNLEDAIQELITK